MEVASQHKLLSPLPLLTLLTLLTLVKLFTLFNVYTSYTASIAYINYTVASIPIYWYMFSAPLNMAIWTL